MTTSLILVTWTGQHRRQRSIERRLDVGTIEIERSATTSESREKRLILCQADLPVERQIENVAQHIFFRVEVQALQPKPRQSPGCIRSKADGGSEPWNCRFIGETDLIEQHVGIEPLVGCLFISCRRRLLV